MSGFNLDFSGLFSGGFTNNLNKNNFDFSAYAPKKETVTDPVDVVSNNTPDAQVDILEGAGTVAITKQPEVRYSSAVTNAIAPDSIEQAIQSVQPILPDLTASPTIDLGMDFSVAPIAETSKPMQSVVGSGAGFDVTNPSDFSAFPVKEEPVQPVDNTVTYDPIEASLMSSEEDEKDYYQSILNSPAPSLELGMDNPAAFKDETGRPQVNSGILDYFTGQEQARIGLQDLRPAAQGEEDNEREAIAASNMGQDLVDKYNIPTSFSIDENYNWVLNPETLTYNKQMVSATGADVALMAGTMIASAGLGAAIAGSGAVTSLASGNVAVASAIGQGVANGLTTVLQGGNTEDILLNTTIGAIQGGAEGLNQMTATARDAATVIGASQEAIKTATTLGAQADVMNNIVNGINLVQAVDQKDPLKAIESALLLTDNESLSTIVKDGVVNITDSDFVANNVDMIASTIIGATEAAVKGEDAEGIVTNAVNTAIKDNVLTKENVSTFLAENTDSEGFVADNFDAIVEGVIKGGNELLDGNNKEGIAIEALQPIVKKNVKELVENIGTGDSSFDGLDFIEDAYHEYIEDPLEQLWQDIEPLRDTIEETVGVGVEFVKENIVNPVVETVSTIIKEVEPTVDKVVETVRETGRGAEEIYDTAEDFVKEEVAPAIRDVGRDIREEVDPIANAIRDTGRQAEEVYDTAEDFVKEEVAPVINQAGRDVRETVAPVTEAVRETGRAIEQGYNTAEDFVKEEVAPVIRETGRNIREAFSSDVDVAAIPEVNIPDVDIPFSVEADPEITKERRGFYYDDSSLVSNPFLRGGEQQRIRSLTDMIAMEKEVANRQAKILADEEERKLRYKSVFGVNPNVQVKYNG